MKEKRAKTVRVRWRKEKRYKEERRESLPARKTDLHILKKTKRELTYT